MSDCWHVNHKCYHCGQKILILGLGDSLSGFCVNNHCLGRFRPHLYRAGDERNNVKRLNTFSGMTAQILQGFEDYMAVKSGEIPF